MNKLRKFFVLFAFLSVIPVSSVFAHRSGCHRWHSCPSDTGSYVCGDLGYTSECPGAQVVIQETKTKIIPTAAATQLPIRIPTSNPTNTPILTSTPTPTYTPMPTPTPNVIAVPSLSPIVTAQVLGTQDQASNFWKFMLFLLFPFATKR